MDLSTSFVKKICGEFGKNYCGGPGGIIPPGGGLEAAAHQGFGLCPQGIMSRYPIL